MSDITELDDDFDFGFTSVSEDVFAQAEAATQEGQHIRKNECVNKNIAGRTFKEYYVDNIDKFKDYHEAHKEEKKLYYKNNYDLNKEQIQTIST